MTAERTLDHILAVQLTVAWAGESGGEPPRLGWWDSDLVDELAGGDFFRRLAPHTQHWAALEAVREVARRADTTARKTSAGPDQIRSLFHLGFEMDEQLEERLAQHKRAGDPPDKVLPDLYPVAAPFEREDLEQWLGKPPKPQYQLDPTGRKLRGSPSTEMKEVVDTLAAALLPLSETYSLPYYRVGR